MEGSRPQATTADLGPPLRATDPDAGADDRIVELERRVATLEAAERTTTVQKRTTANATSDPGPPPGPPTGMFLSVSGLLATTITELELTIIERDLASRAGDDARAHDHAVRGAGLACMALDRALDELDLPDDLDTNAAQVDAFLRGEPTAGIAPDPDLTTFLCTEEHLLRLAGLSRELAHRHVTSAHRAYRQSPVRTAPVTPEEWFRSLDDARQVVCRTYEDLLATGRAARSRRRWQRIARIGSAALGGTLVVAANSVALPMIGPFAAAASGALGSAAAGTLPALLDLD